MRLSGRLPRSQSIATAATVLALSLFGSSVEGEAATVVHKVGAVTRHPSEFIGQKVVLEGYALAIEPGYVLLSDEATGKIGAHDLPVTGSGADAMQLTQKYLIEGILLDRGLTPNNGSPYHLELTTAPVEAGH